MVVMTILVHTDGKGGFNGTIATHSEFSDHRTRFFVYFAETKLRDRERTPTRLEDLDTNCVALTQISRIQTLVGGDIAMSKIERERDIELGEFLTFPYILESIHNTRI